MTAAPMPAFAEEIAAAFSWWEAAGVDCAFDDEAEPWLARPGEAPTPAPAVAPAPSAPPTPLERLARTGGPVRAAGGERADWPATLGAFQRWLVEAEAVDAGGAFPRVPPRGRADAALLVLVEQPEEEDTDRLLSGPLGTLLNGFARAAGIAVDDLYRASLLPRRAIRPDWQEIGAAQYGALLAHHLALARPRRILALGRNILSHIPHEPAQRGEFSSHFNHEGGQIAMLHGGNPAQLLARGSARARLWHHWLEWTQG